MVVGTIGSRTDLAIVGAGPGGYVAALRAADAGLEVTLVDRSELGGTCLNVGCIPSKALIETANLRHGALHAGSQGLSAVVEVDGHRLHDHIEAVAATLRSGVAALLTDAGVDIVRGDASFARYDRLSISHGDQVSHVEFDNVIIATGSRPILLPAFDLDDRIVTSTGALALDRVPATMAVIGGGYIGVELGTAWAKLGSRVTIIESQDSILATTAPQLRSPVERRLADIGVEVRLHADAVKPTPTGVLLGSGDEVGAEVIVVAVGRRPNSDQASLDTLDITLDAHGHVVVDQQMRAAPGIYAIGDLVAGPALAHKATAQAETAVDAIRGLPAAFDPAAIPAVIFSDPEIMTAGIDVGSADDLGYTVHRFPHAASARARTVVDPSGATLVVVDTAGTVVGVHAVGPHASELAGEAALAIEMAATIDDLTYTVHPHPTMSESIAEAAWLAAGHPLHVRR